MTVLSFSGILRDFVDFLGFAVISGISLNFGILDCFIIPRTLGILGINGDF